jgi:hypothetical protein
MNSPLERATKLPIELKEKWVAALSSGKYKQGRSFLYSLRTDAFCCLGVYEVECNGKRKSDINHSSWGTIYRYIGTKENELVKMNDGEGKSFAEIADWIEANL